MHKDEVNKDLTILERSSPPFSLQNEISKIKISIPFNEILRNIEYWGQLSKMIKYEESSYSLNLQDHHPKIMFGLGLKP